MPERKGRREKQGTQVRVPCMEEFLAETESETLVATSPHLGEVGSEPAQEVIAKDALEEEENPDTHFKRKHKSLPLGVSPRKKKKMKVHLEWDE